MILRKKDTDDKKHINKQMQVLKKIEKQLIRKWIVLKEYGLMKVH